ncbi:MAG: hypothetical protein A2X28_11265 [Elusimicrobia bacterium GWA2_56_46]|nr:MAG: hypothetical protein A2X28_11265 [Elusimicrobia bacterium GWA2_56_46]OGR54516.1 MAG: hypothetical protein A2X39_10050 [Elusimicrobia bacterium GWC2_56_31]HBB68187.1 hypothetical protein [Elusimicrobiota bacterium]HBW22318.1 hypothetical protein [Elusimicrobiota bacterium]
MKGNLVKGFLAINLMFGISVGVVAGKNTRISIGAIRPASGLVKSIGVGGIFLNRKKTKTTAPALAKPIALSASPAFGLGEIYVYPNPAKSGAVPTFHIESGVADSVRIVIYSVSGRQVHEYTITDQPQTMTTNSKTVEAYKYAWSGHIASGVYYYVIEAKKSGQKLKKSGKFAVIR